MLHQTCRCQCLDTADTCCNTALGNNLEGCDHACVRYMSTTTELCTEITHLDNANLIAVLLTKKSHRTGLFCLFECHLLGYNIKTCRDLIIDDLLNLLNLLLCHCREMREVETKSLGIHVGSLLLNMIT